MENKKLKQANEMLENQLDIPDWVNREYDKYQFLRGVEYHMECEKKQHEFDFFLRLSFMLVIINLILMCLAFKVLIDIC